MSHYNMYSENYKKEVMENMNSRHLIVSVCDLNQWPLDFEGNYERIHKSILECKRQRSSYRLGPELETCGYSCEDHFLELDTLHHNYEIIARLLNDTSLYGIVIDVGCLIHHNGVRYNARAVLFEGQIICIRPKSILANDSNYHEGRWFTPWRKTEMEEWMVPSVIKSVSGQDKVPIGLCMIQFLDTSFGIEICEELFVPNNLHQAQVLNGAEIITNGSGSHFQRGKLLNRFNLVLSATKRCGCAYMYSNLVGCDGGRLYFDGGSFISSCGKLLEFIPRFQFLPNGFAVKSAYIDLDEVKGKRSSQMSWAIVAAANKFIPKVNVNKAICLKDCFASGSIYKKQFDNPTIILDYCDDIEELINAPIFWLWDYLIHSQVGGLFLALSGGADSAATAGLVYILCCKLYEFITRDPTTECSILLLKLVQKIIGLDKYCPTSPKDLCSKLLVTTYMPSKVSLIDSEKRSKNLSNEIGSTHFISNIQPICDTVLNSVVSTLNIQEPKFKIKGGTLNQDIALQNIQARTRALLSYTISQLYSQTFSEKHRHIKGLIVLSSANADESLFGYFTKYDCSSGDINLIGDLSKDAIQQILCYMHTNLKLESALAILNAIPSAELTPICDIELKNQSDEIDMGITYKQLKYLRFLRKVELCGPVSMFRRACHYWFQEQNEDNLKPSDIAKIVKRFFTSYCKNRHKATILPPSVHLSAATGDDNRGDFRPFLYNCDMKWQFSHIDSLVLVIENAASSQQDSKNDDSIN